MSAIADSNLSLAKHMSVLKAPCIIQTEAVTHWDCIIPVNGQQLSRFESPPAVVRKFLVQLHAATQMGTNAADIHNAVLGTTKELRISAVAKTM